MEWIIGFLILGGLSVLFDTSKSGQTELRREHAATPQSPPPAPSSPPAESLVRKVEPVVRGATVEASGSSSNRGSRSDNRSVEDWDEWLGENWGKAETWESPEFLQARSLLNAKGVTAFWHMTHRDNVRNILDQGILSHSEARKAHKIVDISDASVQQRRTAAEPIFGRCLHDYAPLYVNPRNPMLFRLQDLNNSLCLLEISLDVLRDTGSRDLIYTDGNAASGATNFFSGMEGFDNLPWDVLMAEYWNDKEDGKRKRCAEVLIHPKVAKRHISAIHCYSRQLAQELGGIYGNVRFNPSTFFGG
ncbi:DUF4433 domain-containing protein [Mangrovimicrobium sediminis]|uniref:DUF4433 domain-containing protein n=1 Tax=Mangrovimicrobium sediminis TaxID=2562682 RepID=A0A4Z0LYH6_9GAMM|nr:DUF4433 domain-containing protein [Haliea sp. SAOS-164]TGD72207.1 DUF4433 domain-containing protein [Haliea sp. SAOS-164]